MPHPASTAFGNGKAIFDNTSNHGGQGIETDNGRVARSRSHGELRSVERGAKSVFRLSR